MKAGPELDALIAEKVMGWRLKKMSASHYWVGEHDGLEGDWNLVQMWKPSKDIRDAWVVVGKFPFVDIRRRPKGYSVELVGGNGIVSYIGDSAPHAICLAALKAVGLVGIE